LYLGELLVDESVDDIQRMAGDFARVERPRPPRDWDTALDAVGLRYRIGILDPAIADLQHPVLVTGEAVEAPAAAVIYSVDFLEN
jgi:hypothetical protein